MYGWKYFILLVVLLAAATLAVHGHALGDGLFLDDHWHALRLAESDWSLSSLFDSTTIVPERFMSSWWQSEPISWWYIRPFAVFIAKIVYHLSDGSVKALHGLSLVLHLGNALLVHHLVLRMTRRRWWAMVAALLVLVYSHSVYAVAWLAAQNALLQTFLMLLALLAYVRASGLDIYAGPREDAPGTAPAARAVPAAKWLWVLVYFVLWALALLSRESAVVLPALAVGFDLAFGGWRHVRARIRLYAVMAAAAIAFSLWRIVFFNHPMPDFYMQRPHGPEYVLWWLAKLLHCVTATVWLSPMTIGPSGRFNPWREAPADCVLMLVILSIMGIGFYMSSRRVRGWWLWPTWIFLGLMPVVPILATPHNGYLPSVGFAIAMTIAPALRHVTRPTSVGRWCAGVATWFLIATTTYIPIYRPMWYSVLAAERMTIDQVMRMPPGPKVSDVFFVNVPFVNIYARYHIDEAMGSGAKLGVLRQAEPTYRTHALTYAPDLLRMDQDCQLDQIDARRFRVRIEGDKPWFSGALGRYLIEGMRPGQGRLVMGQVVRSELFDVQVMRADERGVRELEFTFHEPLASERFCFYVGTRSCAAARVRFAGPENDIRAGFCEPGAHAVGEFRNSTGLTEPGSDKAVARPDAAAVTAAVQQLRAGHAAAADVLFTAAQSPDSAVRAAARAGLVEICQPVADALAGPAIAWHGAPAGASTGETPVSQEPNAGTPTDWGRVRRWWARHVDDEAVRVLPGYREAFAAARWQRNALFRIRQITSGIIQTDLYLTGPPFPGPR